MKKITALIPCKNEEINIRDCLESVKWADEILVVDSGSTDRTLAIVREYTDCILEHEYVNSAAQKNWAIPQTRHEWILIVDADERVTPELAGEIQELLRKGPEAAAYRIYRRNHFLGKEIKHCGWNRDDVTRFFKKSNARYPEKNVHADLLVDGKVSVLKGRLLHYTCRDLDAYVKKWERYTTWAAGDIVDKNKKAGLSRIIGHPLWRFIKQYILRAGFLDGTEGLIICRLAAMSVFMKYIKAWAILKNKKENADGTG